MEDLNNFELSKNPFESFSAWYLKAKSLEENADAFALATASNDGIPSVRMLLFKGIKDKSFSFYSHYTGKKANEIEQNPNASIVFYWHKTKKQIRVSGIIKKMSREDSITYFESRAKESQIASAISDQSEKIESREKLMARFLKLESESIDKPIICPDTWGGYLLYPNEFEFFLYGDHRLNDRFLFKKNEQRNDWDINRLQP